MISQSVLRRIRVSVSVLMASFGFVTVGSAQEATRFAMTCIGTEVGSAINFSYRWGTTGSWENVSVEPDKWSILTWRYSRPNENQSPVLSIRYDADFTSGTRYVVESLESYASPIDKNCEAYGKTYNFYTDNSGNQLLLVPED
jgi:hypothetical protein